MSCPICGRPDQHRYRPFCSKRCADADLGNWLGGRYAIPADDPDDLDEAARELAAQDPVKPSKPT